MTDTVAPLDLEPIRTRRDQINSHLDRWDGNDYTLEPSDVDGTLMDLDALIAEVERLRAGAEKVIGNFEATAAMNREIGDKAEAEHNETLAWKLRRDILGEVSE